MSNKTRIMNIEHIVVLLVVILCCVLFTDIPVYADKKTNIVKVGVYELYGFHSFDIEGKCEGYDVDYLSQIKNITGWKVEYVKADSWASAIEMLQKGEIDLLSPSQMTTDRLKEFGFSTFPIGKVYAAILALPNNKTVYEDFNAFGKMKFGIEKGNTYTDIFKEYAKNKGFKANIKFYDNHDLLVSALHKGEVDAIVANVMRADKDMHLLGKAGVAQFYYMYRKEDTTLAAELNGALDQIEIDEPNFQSELISDYFPIYNEEPFSKNEIDYVSSISKIRVACAKNARPYSYIDKNTGKSKGILIDYLTKSGAEAGITYEFVPIDGKLDATTIKEKKINYIAETGLSSIEKNKSSYSYSNNFLSTHQLIVCKPGITYSVDQPLKIAWYGINNMGTQSMKNSFPNFSWISYDSAEACFEAVKKGEADACMVNQFAANWNLAKPDYEDFYMVSNSSIAQSLCLRAGVKTDGCNPKDTELLKVINKSFKHISAIDEQKMLIRYTTAMPYELTIAETCYRYRYVIGITSFFVILLAVALILYARNKSVRAHKDVLTGLYNRETGKKKITQLLSSKQYQAGAFLMLDLDYFKNVNDTLGHQAGDRLLKETAKKLVACCRREDVVCRLGGDEFIVYFPCHVPEILLKMKLKQIRSSLECAVTEEDKSVKVSCSIGVAVMPKDAKDYENLYKCADEALYRTKENGRNGYNFYAAQ